MSGAPVVRSARSTRRCRLLTVCIPLVVLALLGGAACVGGSSDVTEVTSIPDASASTPQSELDVLLLDLRLTGADHRMLRLLEFLPSTPDVRESVWLTDFGPLWAAWASQGVDRPTDEDGAGGMDDFFDQLARNNRAAALFARPRVPTPRLSGFDAASAMVDTFTYLGFDERHVDAAAVAGERLDPIEVVTGRLDPDLTSQALGRCTGFKCRAHEIRSHAGTDYYAWGVESEANLENRFALPAFDENGRGSRIAVRVGYAFRSLKDASMETLLDTETGVLDSLRDNAGFVSAVSVAADAGAYALWVSARLQTFKPHRGKSQTHCEEAET